MRAAIAEQGQVRENTRLLTAVGFVAPGQVTGDRVPLVGD